MTRRPTMAGVCSGVGGFDLAFQSAGFDVLWACENDPFGHCQQVLQARFPGVRIYPDMTLDDILAAPRPDVFVGGTPCQGFSVAGLRKGLNDDRSNLALRFIRLADHFDPSVILWENVPGILSDQDNAFGCFLGGLVGADAPLVPTPECGGRWTNAGVVAGPRRTAAWRVLDSQYFGVAQRRERLFVVASARAECPFQVLFESEGVRRHSAPRRKTWERIAPTVEGRAGRSGCNEFATSGGVVEVAGTLGGSAQSGGFRTTDLDQTGAFIPEVAWALQERDSKGCDSSTKDGHLIPVVCPTLRAGANRTGGDRPPGTDVDTCDSLIPVAFEYKKDGADHGDVAPTLRATEHDKSHANGGGHVAVAFTERTRPDGRNFECQEDLAYALTNPGSGGRTHSRQIAHGYAVRRLTPRECERLQAFPDDFTLVQNKSGKPMADGPRYKMMGNSVTTTVIEWIARRIYSCLSNAANRSSSDAADSTSSPVPAARSPSPFP